MRYEGLTNSEIEYLTKPLAELDKAGLVSAIDAKDRYCELIRERNKTFVPDFSAKKTYIIRDDLGTQGILNHSNGKRYDSKSAYYSALKESGHVVMEAGMENSKRETRGDFDVSRELKAAAQQHGLLN